MSKDKPPSSDNLPDFVDKVLAVADGEGFEIEVQQTKAWIRERLQPKWWEFWRAPGQYANFSYYKESQSQPKWWEFWRTGGGL